MSNLNLKELQERYLPLIALTDHSSGFVQWIIKWRTKGHYNHIQWAHKKGKFASQGNTYSEVPYSRYAKPGGRIKFIEVAFESKDQKKEILKTIDRKLKLPWYKRIYDWVGIAGQAIGINKLNTPGLEYCSEDVPDHLKKMANSGVEISDNFKKVIMNIPEHGSPEDFNEYQKQNPEYFRVYGKWDSDEEN